MDLAIIVAYALGNRIIGDRNQMLWEIPDDFDRFARLTKEHAVIQGRKTYESICMFKGGPLKQRYNIVLSRNPDKVKINEGVVIARDMEEAIKLATDYSVGAKKELAWVIGGQGIYEQAIKLPKTKRLEITEVKGTFEGDRYFPEIDVSVWKEVDREDGERFNFVSYTRTNGD